MNVRKHREKAERIDIVKPVAFESEEELRRHLPEVDAIYDEDVREGVVEFFLRACPEYFMYKPASSTGKYHPPDESDEYGTWLHTKRVFYEYANMSESLLELQEITEHERECGKAAALIHDTFNYGWPSENRDMTTSEHDVIAAAVANFTIGMPEEVIHLVHSHMGPWGNGKLPETKNERCFHLADKSAAAPNHTQAVYYPSETLKEAFPDLETVNISEDEVV